MSTATKAAPAWPADRTERWPIERLTPYAHNARTHSEAQVAQIAASMQQWGWTNPVLVDEAGTVIAGHGRLRAAQGLGWTEAPVMVATGWTEAQRRAYALADNKLALNADWDIGVLAEELRALDTGELDLSLIGFGADELEALLTWSPGQNGGLTDPDAVPDVPKTPVSQLGDVWQIGTHRLACGDARDPTVVATLMQKQPARLCFTSPPYAQQRDYTAKISDWDALMTGVFGAFPAMTEDGQVLVNLGLLHRNNEVIPYWDTWLAWMRTQGWRRFGWYVWDQGPGMPGDWAGRLAPSFEFVFHFNRQTRKPNKTVHSKLGGKVRNPKAGGMRGKNGKVGGWTHAGRATQQTRIPDSVIRVMRHKGGIGEGLSHPAVFPVALPKFVIETFSKPKDVVYEPFCGSGTTIMAAEMTGRVCHGLEIDPGYCDVAVKRWQAFTGKTATLESTGRPFKDTKLRAVNGKNPARAE